MPPSQLPAKAQQALNLPPGWKTFSPFPFTGLNTQGTSISIEDGEFPWIENFVHIGPGKLRIAWDVGTILYSAPSPQTIPYYQFFTIGPTYYIMIFLSGGTAVQIELDNNTYSYLTPSLPFYLSSSGFLPVARSWGTQYLLIANKNTPNDYWAWDGAILYGAGTAAPNGVNILAGGSGYTSLPTLTVFGGHGSGIEITPVISGGSIVEMTITAPGTGYQPGDVVQVAAAGGGGNTSPILLAALTATTVAGVTVTAPGSGYTTAAIALTGGGGTGAAAVAMISDGTIAAITITNPGTGYTSAPDVVITGNGKNAAGAAVLTPSGVASVTVQNGGSGFITVPLLSFAGGAGAGATAVANLTATGIAAINVSDGGTGYTSAPTIAFLPSAGGATATANIAGGSVVSVTVTAPGSFTSSVEVTFTGGGGTGAGATVLFQPTSIASVTISSSGQFYTDAPAVEVAPGANAAAYGTINLMPYGVSGSDLDTWESRVFIVDPAPGEFETTPSGGNWQVSAPGSFIDFATSDGGAQALSTDSFLQTRYTAVRQSSGYIYFFGDGSASVITSITTAAASGSSLPTTNYVYQNVDPQAGARWRDSAQTFGRSLIVANETGVYGLYGGTLSKISAKLDGLFDTAVFPPTPGAITPTSTIVFIHAVKHYALMMTIIDPDTNAMRNVMIAWNEKDWTILSQTPALTTITAQKVASNYNAFGSDGTSIYPMFTTPSATLVKRLDTKQYGTDQSFIQKEAHAVYLVAQDNTADLVGVSGSLTGVASGIAIQSGIFPTGASATWPNIFNNQPTFQAPPPYWPIWGTSMGGIKFMTLSLRLETTAPDFTLGNLVVGYVHYDSYYAQSP